jgi:cytochrome c-type biogenesis protein CcmH
VNRTRILLATMLAMSAPLVMAQGELDARARTLEESLRCVVCQNQTLADSNAPLAADLRARIREQLAHGSSDDEIRAFMVQRYGDFVLYRPPVKPLTWALWFGPLVALLGGGIAMARCVARAKRARLHRKEVV